MQNWVEYVPICTTIFSFYFTSEIFKHYQHKRTKYLLWWTLGVVTFGLGTFAESVNVLWGWSAINMKYWYIVGALLGGYPLAQGSVYLLMPRRFANISARIINSVILVASVCVILSPIDLPVDFNQKLTGAVFGWKWVRWFSPFINIYAFIFLVGGAAYSAYRYYGKKQTEVRFKGNIFIAFGGLLPGIGGTFTRMGYVNVLYVTELLGLLLIYFGYHIIKTNKQRGNPLKAALT